MGIVFFAAYFDITVDDGCIVKKLHFICAHGMKKEKREVRKSQVFSDGSSKYGGDIICRKVDMYWEDYFVKGSYYGTLSDPKLSVERILK